MNADAGAPWIESGYTDANGAWQATPDETRTTVARALANAPAADSSPLLFVHRGEPIPEIERGVLVLEDGTRRPLRGPVPRDTPYGYHAVESGQGASTRRTPLVVAPEACFLPRSLDAWGFSVQLYALASRASWGIGDLSDLRRFGRFASKLGAGLLLLNPLDATAPVTPQPTSPYSPSSRIYRNVSYLDVTKIPGFVHADGQITPEPRGVFIERDGVFRRKLAALESVHSRFQGARPFDAYRAREGAGLERFATFSALAERHGANFHDWPAEYRDANSASVARFRGDNTARVRFHEWLQWHLDEQLTAAQREIGLLFDLPVGVDPGGADAWADGPTFASGLSVGAPPDAFNPVGQDWGISGFSPAGLAALHYEPFIRMLRNAFRHAKGLRIDHVMGLFRLFMIPHGNRPTEGAYVRYPSRELLDLVALESHRAGAFVVGEDLGTVDPAHRDELARRRVLSYRLALFEDDPPSSYPRDTLAAVTTHDLPTIAGLVSGSDVEERRALGMPIHEEGERALVERVRRLAGATEETPMKDVIVGVHRALAHAPSRVRLVAIEDAIGSPLRPNIPGIAGPPSFCRPLEEPLEGVEKNPLTTEVARVFRRLRVSRRSRARS